MKQAIRRALPQRDHGFAVSLMEHLVVPTFVLGADCRVLIWNKACERLTGVRAESVIGASDHWQAFYAERRPCLADLLLERRFDEIGTLYANGGSYGLSDFGVSAENWCVMPKVGRRLYLAIDAGPIYDEFGRSDRGGGNASRRHRAEAGANRSRGPGDPRRPHGIGEPAKLRRQVRRRSPQSGPRSAAFVAADDRHRLFQTLQRHHTGIKRATNACGRSPGRSPGRCGARPIFRRDTAARNSPSSCPTRRFRAPR